MHELLQLEAEGVLIDSFSAHLFDSGSIVYGRDNGAQYRH